MNGPIQIVRYMLILAPAIWTMTTTPPHEVAPYTCFILLLLWLIQIQRKLEKSRLCHVLLWAEIALIGWLAWAYGGNLYMLPFSTAVSVFNDTAADPFVRPEARKSTGMRSVWIPGAVLMAVLIVVTKPLPVSWSLSLCLAFACWASALYTIRTAAAGMNRTELLNDELRRKHYELEEARKTIFDYARKVESAAQAEERNRISRDIHDELGHKLIRLKLMMDAACAVMSADPDKDQELVRQVRGQLADSMDILRSTVRRLKPDESEMQYSLSALIDDLGKSNSIDIGYSSEGLPYPLYPSEEIVLYRNAQEAVTNGIRHGGANRFTIRLRYGERTVAMTISNNGTAPDAITRKGLGVSGMEERVKLLGGSLAFVTEPEFSVTTVIPRHAKLEGD